MEKKIEGRKYKEVIVTNVIFFLAIFPHINFLPGFGGDMQPVGVFLIGLYYISFSKYKLKLIFPVIFILSFLLFYIAYLPASLISRPFFGTIVYSSLYFVGPLFWLFFYTRYKLVSERLVFGILVVLLLISVIEYFGPNSLRNLLESLLNPILSRYQAYPHPGNRGVSSLYSEPSHAGRYIFVLLAFWVYFYYSKKINKLYFFVGFIFLVMISIFNQSGTLFMLLFAMGSFYSVFYFTKLKVKSVLASLMAILLGAGMVYVGKEDLRGAAMLFDLYKTVSQREVDVYTLEKFGGRRFIQVYVGYGSPLVYPLGQGLASYTTNFRETASELNLNLNKIWWFRERDAGGKVVKPNSYFGQIVFDMGFVGIFFVSLFSFGVLRIVQKRFKRSTLLKTFPLVGLFQVVLSSLTTIPAPWLLLSFMGLNQVEGHGVVSGLGTRSGARRNGTGLDC